MTPCEILGSNARYLDALADTTPHGLIGTPFGVVSDALRFVAAWAWYLGARPSALAVDGFRALLCAALVSECAPLVRESQTVGELVALLSVWMDYRPVFADMEALFATYGVRVDVRAISDPEGQSLLPVDDTRLAFYIFVLSMDWQRPMLLGEIAETARRASPLGARPFVVYYVEGLVSVPVAPAPTDGFLWVNVWESAVQPIPPGPTLPTVSVTGDFGVNNELDLYGGGMGLSVPIIAGETSDATLNGTTKVTYDNGKSYGVVYWFTGTPGRTDIALINNNGNLAFKNITNQKFYTRDATVAVCSSNLGTVVTVYDSSNNTYNAFKYTTNGTDYYYVLDGTQTDWTNDLAGIGYRLPYLLYLSSNKAAVRVTELGPYTYGYELYNEDGSTFISSSLPTLLEAWSDSSESSKIADFNDRIGLVIKSNNVVLDGKGSYNTWVQRISVL